MARKKEKPSAPARHKTADKHGGSGSGKPKKHQQSADHYELDREEERQIGAQLALLGLRLVPIAGDGNCLFRALGHGLDGSGDEHARHRQDVVDYIRSHREDFEPFVEDDVPFDEHIDLLERMGTFGGNDSIVAFAFLHKINVCIHQLGQPRWDVVPAGMVRQSTVHVAYHNGEHYSAVEPLAGGDNGSSGAKRKALTKAAKASAVLHAHHDAAADSTSSRNPGAGAAVRKPHQSASHDGELSGSEADDGDEVRPERQGQKGRDAQAGAASGPAPKQRKGHVSARQKKEQAKQARKRAALHRDKAPIADDGAALAEGVRGLSI